MPRPLCVALGLLLLSSHLWTGRPWIFKPAVGATRTARSIVGGLKLDRHLFKLAKITEGGHLESQTSHLDNLIQPILTHTAAPLFSAAPTALTEALHGAALTGRRVRRVANVLVSAASYIRRWRAATVLTAKDSLMGSRMHRSIAQDMKLKFVSLGPTYIKLGQLLSTRPDLIGREYVEAFKELQDRVPPFSSSEVVALVECELGGRVQDIFSSFNSTPLASASIGQVHLAEVNGTRVAVKVQRPSVRQLFDMDLDVLRALVGVLDRFYSNIDGLRCDWKGIFEEYVAIMYKELDYRREALNGIRFKNNFGNTPWIAVPEVWMNLSTSRVLTMEYLPGTKITDVKKVESMGIDRKVLANRLADSYLMQLCQHGFFHCDPHAGNLACDNFHPGGRLIYYDFGMMSELRGDIRKNFVALILAMYENDVQAAYDAFFQIGVIDTEADQNEIKKVLTVFLDEFNSLVYTASGIYTTQLSQEEQNLLVRKRRLKLGAELWMKLQNEGLFNVPSTFTFITRAFNMLDGVGKTLDSRYDLFKLAQPFVSELVQTEAGLSNTEIQFWRSSIGRFLLKSGFKRTSPRKSTVKYVTKDSKSSKKDQEDIKRLVFSSRQKLYRIMLQKNNLIQLTVLLTLFCFPHQSRQLEGKSTRLGWTKALTRGLQIAATSSIAAKLVLEALDSRFALKEVQS